MRRAAGFSLVELMVSITLGLLVIGSLLGLFAGTRSANRSTTGISGLTDGGRFALDFISQSGRVAGFYACNSSAGQTILQPGATPLPFDFPNPLSGFEAKTTAPGDAVALTPAPVVADASAADWLGGLDGALAGRPIKGSDVLTVHSSLPRTGATPALPVYVTAIVSGSNSFAVNAPGQLAAGQLAAISDCVKTATFVVTGFDGVNVFHNAGGPYPGNSVGTLPFDFQVGSQVAPITTTVYYIGVGADGDGALFSLELKGIGTWAAPRELVPDIENMQVLYGYDVNGDQSTYRYVTADQVVSWPQVASIHVAVLAASSLGAVPAPAAAATFNLLGTTVTAPIDTRLRQAFETTITVRNSVN